MFDNRLLDQATSRGVDVVPGERVDVIDTVEKRASLLQDVKYGIVT